MADITFPAKHGFVSPKPDDPDPTKISPSHWNAEHVIPGKGILQTMIADLAIDTAQMADHAVTIDKLATAIADRLVPVGTIVIWSGSVGTIPTGWKLCDGNNGTVNLVDKFVVGAGSTYAVASSGGATAHSHTNTFSINNGGVDHIHNVSGNSNSASEGSGDGGSGTPHNLTPSSHVHGVNINSGGSSAYLHSHGISGSVSSAAGNSLPPYLALCYIQKV